MAPTSIQSLYPWTQFPLLVGAPMGGYIASPAFAVAVTESGGFGFLGTGMDASANSAALEEAKALLASSNARAGSEVLPVGIGFLLFGAQVEGAVEAVQKYRPAAVWLFAARELGDYAMWTRKIREASPKSHVWVQTGSVADAMEIARTCKPEVLVCQGADAGGHGLEKGAGVISLLPEMADELAAKGFGDIALVAAGGIAEGRGVAAAMALGAVGAVMGTRFLASPEVKLPAIGYQTAILAATDGGQATVRDKVFDEVGPRGNPWPVAYDGRAIRNLSWQDKTSGVAIEKNRELQAQAIKDGNDATGGSTSRVSIWAGTGVGLVKQAQPTAEIVDEVRKQAREVLGALQVRT